MSENLEYNTEQELLKKYIETLKYNQELLGINKKIYKQIAKQSKELTELKVNNEKLNFTLECIYYSKSWKYTKYLRLTNKKLRKTDKQ